MRDPVSVLLGKQDCACEIGAIGPALDHVLEQLRRSERVLTRLREQVEENAVSRDEGEPHGAKLPPRGIGRDAIYADWKGGPGHRPGDFDRWYVESHLLGSRDVLVTDEGGLNTMCNRLRHEHGFGVYAEPLRSFVDRWP